MIISDFEIYDREIDSFLQGNYKKAAGRSWHTACFACYGCRASLATGTLFEVRTTTTTTNTTLSLRCIRFFFFIVASKAIAHKRRSAATRTAASALRRCCKSAFTSLSLYYDNQSNLFHQSFFFFVFWSRVHTAKRRDSSVVNSYKYNYAGHAHEDQERQVRVQEAPKALPIILRENEIVTLIFPGNTNAGHMVSFYGRNSTDTSRSGHGRRSERRGRRIPRSGRRDTRASSAPWPRGRDNCCCPQTSVLTRERERERVRVCACVRLTRENGEQKREEGMQGWRACMLLHVRPISSAKQRVRERIFVIRGRGEVA
jgi:hypothetical protein